MKTAVIIQARMGSERLPGKVMQTLRGKSILHHVIERVQRALTTDEIIVATTDNPADEIIVQQCKFLDVASFRGSETDVLNRYYLAAKLVKSDLICRVTADNPLVEPGFIDMAVARMKYSHEDYVAIDGCPLGTGIEVFTRQALHDAAAHAKYDYEHEHVTPYIRRHSKLCKIGMIEVPLSLMYPDLRLTVDTPDDFALMQVIYDRLYRDGSIINIHEVIRLFLNEPELTHLNAHIQQKLVG